MEFVVNEWLPEYYKPDATHEEKQKLQKFLIRFMERNDKIYVRRPSAFLIKIERFAKVFQQSNIQKYGELKKFYSTILLDSERCKFIDDDEFDLSDSTRNRLIKGGNKISDLYLFEAASATESKIILTTDTKLKDWMHNKDEYKVELLDDFLKTY
jgi:hypothetical protein